MRQAEIEQLNREHKERVDRIDEQDFMRAEEEPSTERLYSDVKYKLKKAKQDRDATRIIHDKIGKEDYNLELSEKQIANITPYIDSIDKELVDEKDTRENVAKERMKKKYSDVADWINDHTYSREEVIKKVDQIEKDIKDGKEIRLGDYTDEVRAELNKRFPKIVDDILNTIPANGTAQLEIASSNNDVRKLNKNKDELEAEFKKWIQQGFQYNFDDFDEHMVLSDGDRHMVCPVWALKYFKIKVANTPHAPGGNFCPYILSLDWCNIAEIDCKYMIIFLR